MLENFRKIRSVMNEFESRNRDEEFWRFQSLYEDDYQSSHKYQSIFEQQAMKKDLLRNKGKKFVIIVSRWDLSPNPDRDSEVITELLSNDCPNIIFCSEKSNSTAIANAMFECFARSQKDNQNSNFELDVYSESLDTIENIRRMNNEDLKNLAIKINEPRLFLPKTEDEWDEFENLREFWEETIVKKNELALALTQLRETDPYAREGPRLTQALSLINESLAEIDYMMKQSCPACRNFPLKNQDSLLLIYDPLEEEKSASVKAIFLRKEQPTLLDPSLLPKELASISSLEHFAGLLKNARIEMKTGDSEDLTKSTFAIIQSCPGGMPNKIRPFVKKILDSSLVRIEVIFSLSKKIGKKIVEVVEKAEKFAMTKATDVARKVKKNSSKTLLGGSLIGGGATALALGVPITAPLVSIALGTYAIIKKKKEDKAMKRLKEEEEEAIKRIKKQEEEAIKRIKEEEEEAMKRLKQTYNLLLELDYQVDQAQEAVQDEDAQRAAQRAEQRKQDRIKKSQEMEERKKRNR